MCCWGIRLALQLLDGRRSPLLDDRVQQVLYRNVVSDNLTLHAVHFRLLLLDSLLQVGQLVLQRLNHFLRDFLLLHQLRHAGLGVLSPVLVLFVHRIDVVAHKVYAFAQWVCALTQNLNGFLHEFNVLFGESSGTQALIRCFVPLLICLRAWGCS